MTRCRCCNRSAGLFWCCSVAPECEDGMYYDVQTDAWAYGPWRCIQPDLTADWRLIWRERVEMGGGWCQRCRMAMPAQLTLETEEA